MMRRLLLGILCLVAAPAVSLATERPAARIRVEATPDILPERGQFFLCTFVVEVVEPADLVSVAFDSPRDAQGNRGYEPVGFNIPPEQPLFPGVPFRADLQLMVNDPTQPVWFDVNIGGQSRRKYFNLLPQNVATLVPDWSGQTPKRPDHYAELERPGPADPPAIAPRDREAWKTPIDEPDEVEDPGAQKVIRKVLGYLRYQHPDGTMQGVDSATIALYDEDSGADDLLQVTTTFPDGFFAFEFPWFQSGDPDYYILVRCINAVVDVVEPGPWQPTYELISNTQWNVTATNHYFGEWQNPTYKFGSYLHALGAVSRAWRVLHTAGFGSIDDVDILMPDDDTPNYGSYWEEISIPLGDLFESGTLWHEYGHHIEDHFGDSDSTDYCNPGGRCDNNGCRHCWWCEETPQDAWHEGFADWMGDYMTRHVASSFHPVNEPPGGSVYDYETQVVCTVANGGNNTYDDPYKTEGALAALLRDLEDGGLADVDPRTNGGQDKLAFGAKAILETAFNGPFLVETPQDFTSNWFLRYPEVHQKTWFTAFNNGYNFDSTPPGPVTNITSPSHPTTAPYPDYTIEFAWTPAVDDLAGIGGHATLVASLPLDPGFLVSQDEEPSLVTGFLPAGTYYLTVRPVDRAGNWYAAYSTFGPVTIRDPEPANLLPQSAPGFYDAIVPTSYPTLLPGTAPDPVSLPSPTDEFYMNFSVYNSGELPTAGQAEIWGWLDGEQLWSESIPTSTPLGPLEFRTYQNLGPHVFMQGGRHTFGLLVDATENLAEPSETDNLYVRQWIFAPELVAPTNPLTRPAPSRPHAGWWNPPMFTAPNCSGVRLNASGQVYSALVMVPEDPEDDYDLMSYHASLGAESGFEPAWPLGIGLMAQSLRGAGCVDAILVAPAIAGGDEWDVGVVNANPLSRGELESPMQLHHVDSIGLPLDVLVPSSLPAGAPLGLFHYSYGGRGTARRAFELLTDPTAPPVHVAVYAENTDHAGLLDYWKVSQTAANGRATLRFQVNDGPGHYAIVVWREPKESGAPSSLPELAFTARVLAERPDLTPGDQAGWHAPLVPRPAADGTPASVPAPTVLLGDAASTWLNSLVANAGPQAATNVDAEQQLDGIALASQTWPTLLGESSVSVNATSPVYVRGGRHTITLRLDAPGVVAEEEEDNNVFAAQWIWQPVVLAVDALVNRTAPPDVDAGHAELLASGVATPQPNCDALRLPVASPTGDDGHWLAMVAWPGPASDVDLHLYARSTGPTAGFDTSLVASASGTGQLEYVLVNSHAANLQNYDVGVVKNVGDESYGATVVASQWLGVAKSGALTLPPGRALTLYEVELPAGPTAVHLSNVSGGAELGLSLHRAKLPYHSRQISLAATTTAQWGDEAILEVEVPETGRYCLAVFKNRSADVSASSDFDVEVSTLVTGSPSDGAPTRTQLTGVSPNPFNPSTTLRFMVDSDQQVALRILDVRGSLVRVLLDEALPRGQHSVRWDGRGQNGAMVASGVYYAQLAGEATRSTKKLLLLK